MAAWHDRDLLAGDAWEKVILHHLQSAHLILPIISIDFFNSDYIEQVEIVEAFQRYKNGEAHILPIIARQCKWMDDPRISQLQALPEDGRPIARWESRDDAFESVYDGIKGKILDIHDGWRTAAQAETWRKEDGVAFAAARTRADFEGYLKRYTFHAREAQQKVDVLKKEAENVIETARQQDEATNRSQYAPDMVLIKGGTFRMGGVFNEKDKWVQKPYTVTVGDFYLGKYAVTFGEYDRFCTETDREKSADEGWGRGRRPVINVSWNDAEAYCQWLSKKTGSKFRLPTEAEWEYAAREGGKLVLFGNGRDIADPAEINFNTNRKYKEKFSMGSEYWGKTVEVGSLNCSNALGLHDMSGNVWEWCADWFKVYPIAAKNNPTGPKSGSERIIRGGSWSNTSNRCRVKYRNHCLPGNRFNIVGFRLAGTLWHFYSLQRTSNARFLGIACENILLFCANNI